MANHRSKLIREKPDASHDVERVSPDDLFFDARNPRLVEYLEDEAPTQTNLLRILWQEMAVDELAMSMAASGWSRR